MKKEYFLKMTQPFWKKTKLQKSFGLILMDGLLHGLKIKRSDLIVNAIKTFEKHPSILKIKELNSSSRFSIENLSLEDVTKVTWELNILKASKLLDGPTKITKQNADIFSEFSFINTNHSLKNSTFPEQLK